MALNKLTVLVVYNICSEKWLYYQRKRCWGRQISLKCQSYHYCHFIKDLIETNCGDIHPFLVILLAMRFNSSASQTTHAFCMAGHESASVSHDTWDVPLFRKPQGHDERKAVFSDSISLSNSDCYLKGVPCEHLQSFNPSLKLCLEVMLMKLNSQRSQGEGSASLDKCSSGHCDSTRHPVLPTASLSAHSPVPEVFRGVFKKKRSPSLHQCGESCETGLLG